MISMFKRGDQVQVLVDRADSADVREGDVFTVASVHQNHIMTTGPGWYLTNAHIRLVNVLIHEEDDLDFPPMPTLPS